jgi:hypothetical protein
MQLFPNSGTLAIAALLKTALAASKLRLIKGNSFIPGVSTTRAELIALEADFTGYPAGGATIAAMLNPLLNPVGGASIDWPTVQFAAASPYTVGNVICGWWLETAEGVVIALGNFPQSIPVAEAGQGFPMSGSLVIPSGS